MASAAVGAVVAVAVLWLGQRAPLPVANSPKPAELGDAVAQADAPAATPLPNRPTHSDAAVALAESPTAADRGPATTVLSVDAEPDTLRVWTNTNVRLRVQLSTGQPPFDDYVWHFEDGSDPVRGAAVQHTFAESVRDRHVTVEALRAGQPPVVVSRTLTVERIVQAPLDGELTQEAPPDKGKGVRLLLAMQLPANEAVAAVARAAGQFHASVVVAAGDDVALSALADALTQAAPKAALFRLRADGNTQPYLARAADPAKAWNEVQVGDRSTGVWASADLAIVPMDTRPEVLSEAALGQVRAGLAAAAAYPNVIAVTTRPLTPLRDGELVADRAYRLYEYALRYQVTLVASVGSEVYYDGRFGGIGVVSVGRTAGAGCVRLMGTQACQAAAVTVVEVADKRRWRSWHLLGPDFDRAVADSELPREAGKVRR